MLLLISLIYFLANALLTVSWNEWNYSTTWIDGGGSATDIEGKQTSWYSVWGYPGGML